MWESKINYSKWLIYGIEIDSQALRMDLLLLGGAVLGEGLVREFGIDVYTLLFLTRTCYLAQETAQYSVTI